MKNVLAVALMIPSFAMASDYTLDKSVRNGASVEFLKFEGIGQWDNYLAMNIPFEPIADLFRQLLIEQRKPLTSRGEAPFFIVVTSNDLVDIRKKVQQLLVEKGGKGSEFEPT